MADLVALLVYLHELLVYVFFAFKVLSSKINELNEQIETYFDWWLETLITPIRIVGNSLRFAFSYRDLIKSGIKGQYHGTNSTHLHLPSY